MRWVICVILGLFCSGYAYANNHAITDEKAVQAILLVL